MSDVTAITEPLDERRSGRPRDAAITPSVLDAVRSLLAERGYAATSMSAVAERAGTSVPALYRRWSGKVALVEAALFAGSEGMPATTGEDLAADLAAWVRSFLDTSAHPSARAGLPGLLAEYGHDPAQLARLVGDTEDAVRAVFAAMVAAAVARGEAEPTCDVDLMFDLLRATSVVRGVLEGERDLAAYTDRLTAALVAVASVPAASPSS